MATNVAEVKPAVEKAVNEFAARGFRSLGVARADQDDRWQFVGVLPMSDPPREQAKATIASAVQMGVKVKMVTGDQLAIAKEMSHELGMGTNILDATVLRDKQKKPETAASIENADGFAQVFPEDKYNIVNVLQKHGHIVGMTGDGVNDAPALKQANCGIAVSGATDAARAAADIVLLASGLSVIIDSIKESRRIFQRMNSYAIYRIAETLRVLFFMTLAILVFNFYPVTAVMIVMIAVLNDGAILSIAYDKVHYSDRPEKWNMRLVLESGRAGRYRSRRSVRAVLSRRACFSPRPRACPNADVPEAVRSRTFDDFFDSHAGPVLVDTPGSDSLDSGARHTNCGDADCCLRRVYDAAWLALGGVCLGLRAGVVPAQ